MIFEAEMPQGSSGDAPGVGEPNSPFTRGAATAGKRTLAEELRLQLADDIVRGALEPGSALDESEIARRFNVSRTPVREA
ncbi:GntR family transcriptional regulator, partial [Enterococcus faecalis]|uniref:GntR family transcriptional regulator n=2 Tax=Bacteria TaxID=2 RepID=UPI003D6C1D1C